MSDATQRKPSAADVAAREAHIKAVIAKMGPCYICKTMDYGRIMPIRVENGIIGWRYFTNLPEGAVICNTCYDCAIEGSVPDVTMTKAYTVKCQVCKTMYPPANLVGTDGNQGEECSVFWCQQYQCFHGCWGSHKFDMDSIRPSDTFPAELLSTLESFTDPVCDACMSGWAEKGWLINPHTGLPYQ